MNAAFPNRDDPRTFSYFGLVFECIPGITIAGFFYPVFAASYLFCRFAIPELIRSGIGIGELGVAFGALILWLFALCALSLATAFLSSWMCGLFLVAFNLSVGRPLKPIIFVSCFGGLSGYLPSSFVFADPGSVANAHMFELAFVGPFLATLIGQTGARWWAKRRVLLPQTTRIDLSFSQFRILHIFALTAWCALALGIFRLAQSTGLPLMFGLYLPTQLLCFLLGHYLDRLADWKYQIRFVN